MIIYYNPGCSKCREAISLLEEKNCSFEVREYLKEPPSEKELKELLQKLNCKASDIVRKSEPLYTERFEGKNINEEEWLSILSQNPVLIERPIVISGDKAIIGRPPVKVLDLA
jgi:arsenate reductase